MGRNCVARKARLPGAHVSKTMPGKDDESQDGCVTRGDDLSDKKAELVTESKETSDRKPHRFQPGQSGNPGGRSLERDRLRRYLTDQVGQEVIDGIVSLAREAKSQKVRLDALTYLADQILGRAPAMFTDEEGNTMDAGQQAELLMVLMRRVTSGG